MDKNNILEIRGLVKRFSGVTAINGVDLDIKAGEVRAIIGENGAGKSTLCNMITGVLPPTSGDMFFDGNKVQFRHPKDALDAGIRMVYQERNLIDYLTGAQSICLGLEELKHRWFVDESKITKRAQAVCDSVGIEINLNIPVWHLSPAEQQTIEILRAVVYEPKLLILDEPTSALGREEVEMLFGVIRRLKANNVAIIIITHKLEEVFEISDSISVFRNGKHIITVNNGDLTRKEIISHMLGRDATNQYPPVENSAKDDENLLELRGFIDHAGKMKGLDLTVAAGEVVGIYGLLGSGRTEILESVFGLYPRRSGEMLYNGKPVPPKTNSEKMIEQGMFLIPEDRRHTSVFREFLDLKENLTLGYLYKYTNNSGFLSGRKEKSVFQEVSTNKQLSIKFSNPHQNISELSGGNQQKVVLGRWIFRESLRLLILDEPTQGIDVGVKHDVYVLIRELAQKGAGILMVSSELPELVGVCDRMYVLNEGEVCAELERADFDDEKILEMVL